MNLPHPAASRTAGGKPRTTAMTCLGTLGLHMRSAVRRELAVLAVLGTLLRRAACPRHWPRTTRAVFARQILFTGVEALRFVSLVALLTGVSVVVQAQVWLNKAGQSGLLGAVLTTVILRELAPFLVNFIIIGRSGTAMAVELATMKVFGEVRVLEAQGLDPLLYLAMPRALAMAVSGFCLTIWFTLVAFASGYAFGILFGIGTLDPLLFVHTVLQGLKPADIYNLLAKTLVPGLATATLCILEGLNVQASITEIPQAATRAVVRSIAALFLVSAIVSVLTYL